MDDRELIREYVQHHSETAFGELVRRYVDLVYSTALRMVREPSLAEDVSQSVFLHLARKAACIREARALPGWLYRVTHHQAANAIRADRARRRREREALTMAAPQDESSEIWESVAPHLEQAMASLSRRDQDAVVLRFFQGRSWREVGEALSLTEDAAQKRVSRALVRLRSYLARRGVKATVSVLTLAMTAHAVQAAPAGLASTITTTSMAGVAGTGLASWSSVFLGGSIMKRAVLALFTIGLAGVVSVAVMGAKDKEPAVPADAAPAEAVNLDEGLVLHMTFDEAEADGKISDQSSEKNDGKVTGARWIAQGRRGGAYEFAKDGDRIEIANTDSLNPPCLTLAAWIKTTTADDKWRRIFDKSWDQGFALSVAGEWQGRKWNGQVSMEIGPDQHCQISPMKVADGQWHHVVATFDGLEQWIYIDGKPNGKPLAWVNPGEVGKTDCGLAIGCNRSNPPGGGLNEVFRGVIDEPMMWNRALSRDEVAALYKKMQQ